MTKPKFTLSAAFTPMNYFNSDSNTVISETLNSDAALAHIGIPIANITENIGYKAPFITIALSGEFRGTEADIVNFVEEIELQMKPIQVEKVYTSSIGKEYTTSINNFTYTTSPNTNKIGWTLGLFDENI